MAQELRSYNQKFNSYHKEKYQSEVFTLIRLQSVFVLWSVGLLISILIFIIEKSILKLGFDKFTDYQLTDYQLTDKQLTDNQLADNQLTGNQITDNQLTDKQHTDNQLTDNQITDDHITQIQAYISKDAGEMIGVYVNIQQ